MQITVFSVLVLLYMLRFRITTHTLIKMHTHTQTPSQAKTMPVLPQRRLNVKHLVCVCHLLVHSGKATRNVFGPSVTDKTLRSSSLYFQSPLAGPRSLRVASTALVAAASCCVRLKESLNPPSSGGSMACQLRVSESPSHVAMLKAVFGWDT